MGKFMMTVVEKMKAAGQLKFSPIRSDKEFPYGEAVEKKLGELTEAQVAAILGSVLGPTWFYNKTKNTEQTLPKIQERLLELISDPENASGDGNEVPKTEFRLASQARSTYEVADEAILAAKLTFKEAQNLLASAARDLKKWIPEQKPALSGQAGTVKKLEHARDYIIEHAAEYKTEATVEEAPAEVANA